MQNVLLGRDGRAKVSDVGLAKLLGEEEQQQQQQQLEKQQVPSPQRQQAVQQQGQQQQEVQQGYPSQTTGHGFVGTFTWAGGWYQDARIPGAHESCMTEPMVIAVPVSTGLVHLMVAYCC